MLDAHGSNVMRDYYLPSVLVCPFLAASFAQIEDEIDRQVLDRFFQMCQVDSGDLIRYFHSSIPLGMWIATCDRFE
jgi:hypothetical protein